MAITQRAAVNAIVCALFFCLVGASGCRPSSPVTPSLSGKPGGSGVRQLETKKGNVILTRADAHYVNWDDKLALVVLCDFSGSDRSSGGDTSGRFRGHSAKAGRRVEWQWETLDGKSGTVVINGKKYDRSEGGLFLVYTKGEQTHVVQRKRDFEGDEKVLDQLATNDPMIKQFVAEALEPE